MRSFAQFGNDLYTGKLSINFVGRRMLWYTIAVILIVGFVLGTVARGGFAFGIEFTGGSQFTVSNVADQEQTIAQDAVADVVPGAISRIAIIGGDTVRVQTDQLTNRESDEVRDSLARAYGVNSSDVDASFVGATWGQDITSSAIRALIIFLVLAGIVMAIYFRTWKMSLAAMIALLHDLVITAGVYGTHLGMIFGRRKR